MQIGVDIGVTPYRHHRARGQRPAPSDQGPDRSACGVAGVRSVVALAGAEPGSVRRFIHGTIVATNAVREQMGAVTGILLAVGFGTPLSSARQKRIGDQSGSSNPRGGPMLSSSLCRSAGAQLHTTPLTAEAQPGSGAAL